MFVILSYDINQKRVGKVMRICRKYLKHVHRSVFEGCITEAALGRMKREIENKINVNEDSVCIYRMESLKFTRKEQIGTVEVFSHII